MASTPLDIDWPGIRAAAVALGNVSEAARQAAGEMNDQGRERFRETVCKRAVREQWLSKAKAVRVQTPTLATMSVQRNTSKLVQSGADTVMDCIAEDGKATKVAGMRYAKRTVEYAARLAEDAPEQALAMAGDVKASLQSAAIAGDWGAKDSGSHVTLAFFSVAPGADGPVIDV